MANHKPTASASIRYIDDIVVFVDCKTVFIGLFLGIKGTVKACSEFVEEYVPRKVVV